MSDMSMTGVLGEFLTAPGSVMCNMILSHFNVMFALEVSWYIVYQSILAIAQKSLLCIREFVAVADPAVS